MDEESDTGPADHPAEAARRLGEAATEATFGTPTGPGKPAAVAMLLGEVGPKAQAASALRDLNRTTDRRGELAPRGSSVQGMGWLLAMAVGAVALVAAVVIALLVWATS